MNFTIGPDPSFLDSNVVVYAFLVEDSRKSAIAQQLIGSLARQEAIRISAQVLQETYNTLTTKGRRKLTALAAVRYLRSMAEWHVTEMTPDMVCSSAELSNEAKISFWDALIVIAAKKAGAKRLYTEDLSHGQKILGVEVVNPFLL